MMPEYRTLDKPHIRKTSPKQDGPIFNKKERHIWPWLVILEMTEDGRDRGMAFSSFGRAAAFARRSHHDRTRITQRSLEANRKGYQYHYRADEE